MTGPIARARSEAEILCRHAERLQAIHDETEHTIHHDYRTEILAAALAFKDAAHRLPGRPVGACPGKTSFDRVMAYCVYEWDHTGAHRDKSGRTWQ